MLRAALFGLLAGASQETCPAECHDPICHAGGSFNGGLQLVDGLCQQTCSRKFGTASLRYCGKGSEYEVGNSINCTACAPSRKQVEDTPSSSGPPKSIRAAILEEARNRLESWYADQDALNLPYWSWKASIQQSKQWFSCDFDGGDMQVPVTFGQFNVSGAAPIYVFNALSNVELQMSWDSTVSQVHVLKDDEEDGVRGVQMELPSGIFMVPAREVFEWLAFNASLKDQEFWFAITTQKNEPLHEVRHPDKQAVEANNCLGAYWIRPCPAGGEKNCPVGNPQNCCPDGGSRVLFTSHVNVHPPPVISAKTIFDASWPKQIEWINALKKRAWELVKADADSTSSPSVVISPDWLWKDGTQAGSGVALSFPTPKGVSTHMMKLYELGVHVPHLQEMPVSFALGLFVVGFLTVAARKWRSALPKKIEVRHLAACPESLLAEFEEPLESPSAGSFLE